MSWILSSMASDAAPVSKNTHPCRPSRSRVAESSLEEKSEDPQDQTGGRAEVSLCVCACLAM